MTKKQTTIGSDTWEWEETKEVREALDKLHKTIVNNKVIKPNAPTKQ